MFVLIKTVVLFVQIEFQLNQSL